MIHTALLLSALFVNVYLIQADCNPQYTPQPWPPLPPSPSSGPVSTLIVSPVKIDKDTSLGTIAYYLFGSNGSGNLKLDLVVYGNDGGSAVAPGTPSGLITKRAINATEDTIGMYNCAKFASPVPVKAGWVWVGFFKGPVPPGAVQISRQGMVNPTFENLWIAGGPLKDTPPTEFPVSSSQHEAFTLLVGVSPVA